MIQWHTGAKRVATLAFSPDGRLLASVNHQAKLVKLWRPDGSTVGRLSFGRAVRAVAFDPGGRSLAVGTDQRSVSLCGAGGQSFDGILDAGQPARALAFAPGGARLTALAGRRAVSWDRPRLGDGVQAGQQHGRPADHTQARNPTDFGTATALAFTPDGRRLVVNSDVATVVWDVPPTEPGRRLRHPSAAGSATFVAVSPDGRRVAASHGRDISVWSLDDDTPPVTLPGPRKCRWVRGLGFTPDGGLLAAGSDGLARLWDADAGTERQAWDFGLKNLQSLAVSPDGLTAAAGSHDGRIAVWDL